MPIHLLLKHLSLVKFGSIFRFVKEEFFCLQSFFLGFDINCSNIY